MTGTDYTCFDVEVRDHVAHVVMNRPEKANSMIAPFWSELPQIADDLSAGTDARVIVLSAIGRHFCSGMDLSVFGSAGGPDNSASTGHSSRMRAQFRSTALRLQNSFSALEHSRLPVIAAIGGACVGGGIDMVSACDLRYATQDAFFIIQEINIGMTADVGTLQRMPKLVPEGIVRELAYTGRRMDAAEALDRGFVNAVNEDHAAMTEAVNEVAAEIASKSPMAIWGTKQSMNYGRDHSVADGLEYIATWNAAMFDTDDMGEAFKSQIDRRDASFPDHRPLHEGLGA
ncbi:crotonase/enoyl-CoA hydratase family protein [Candidatus Poriferisodalis sp.]|uniref:crotonase/enoyl-CoA hydratase family protein n=1 Tax=Candidatus Poriferisodalis sp. TaxID=3101277 RepID=UPI003B029452